jgi:hypothetical protein
MSFQIQTRRSGKSKQVKSSVEDVNIVSLLSKKSLTASALKAPYYIFAKSLGDGMYSWIIYSLGRPQNLTWGTAYRSVDIEGVTDIDVAYGCRYTYMSVVNNMLEIRKKDGYSIITALARDRIAPTMFLIMLVAAYKEHTGYKTKDINVRWEDIDLEVTRRRSQDQIVESSPLSESQLKSYLEDYAKKLHSDTGAPPNIIQNMRRSDVIPQYIVSAIIEFVEKTPALNEQIPTVCRTMQECDQEYDETCELYGYDFNSLL